MRSLPMKDLVGVPVWSAMMKIDSSELVKLGVGDKSDSVIIVGEVSVWPVDSEEVALPIVTVKIVLKARAVRAPAVKIDFFIWWFLSLIVSFQK